MKELIVFLIGWISFSLFMLLLTKNKLDRLNKKFVWKKYKEETWDDWAFTFICSLGLYLIAPDVFLILLLKYDWMEGIPWSNVVPYTLGAFGGLIFQGLYEIIKLVIESVKERIRSFISKKKIR